MVLRQFSSISHDFADFEQGLATNGNAVFESYACVQQVVVCHVCGAINYWLININSICCCQQCFKMVWSGGYRFVRILHIACSLPNKQQIESIKEYLFVK